MYIFVCYVKQADPRMTLFTGSSRVAEKLAVDLKGRVKLEDAGFDWKILGPDAHEVRSELESRIAGSGHVYINQFFYSLLLSIMPNMFSWKKIRYFICASVDVAIDTN